MKITLTKANTGEFWTDDFNRMRMQLYSIEHFINDKYRVYGYVLLGDLLEFFNLKDIRMPFWGFGWDRKSDFVEKIDFGLAMIGFSRTFYRKAHVRTLADGRKVKVKATTYTRKKTPEKIVLDINVPGKIHLPSDKIAIFPIPHFTANDIVKEILQGE